jgi:peptide/nickel transport system substrate-binding protein
MTMLRIAAQRALFTPPRQVTDDTSVLTLRNLVLEPLLRWEDGVIRPGLFSALRHEAGGRRWIFTIREGAVFHDGKTFVAADVLDFIEGVLASRDMFGMKWSYSRYLEHAQITALDARTVVVENPTSFADIQDIFSEFYPCRGDAAGNPVLGTGPWRVTDYVPDARVSLRHIADPARTIDVVAIPRAEDRLAALRAGRADAAMNLERVQAPLPFDDALVWGRAVNTLACMFYLNCFSGVFANPAARLAANLAVDRAGVVADLFHGLGVLESSVASPLHLGMRAANLTPHPHDRDAAKRLLDGVAVEATLHLRTPEYLPEKALEISERVAHDLAAVGLPCRIEVQPDRPEYAREIGQKIIGDLAIFDSSPHSTYRVLNDKVSSASRGVWWQGYHDAEVERLVLAANHSVEDAAREAAYGAVLRRLHANPPWLYLFHPVEVFAARPGTPPLTLDGKGVLAVL